MPLLPTAFSLTVLLAALTSLGPLSTDMYLPSLPAIGVDLVANPAQVQLTLSVFLAGFAAGQIVYGPLSDRLGRRPVLLGGLALFLAGTLACALATTIDALIAGRLVQAIGAAAGVVLARAVVRDLHSAERAGRMLSHMGALMGAVPAVAPVLGGVLQEAFGWRATFAASALFVAAVLTLTAALLPETLAVERRRRRGVREMLASYGVLAGHARYRRYVALVCFSYAGLFAWISGSSFVLQGIYGLGPRGYGLAFATVVLGYVAGTLAGARLTTARGVDATARAGAVLLAAGGVAMLGLAHIAPPAVWHLLAPMVVYMAGVGLTLPQGMAGALTPFPERAGAASSLLGFVQMTFAALVGIAVGHWLGGSGVPLAASIAAMGVATLAVAFGLRRDSAPR